MFATPTRRLLCWSVVAWFVTRELQVLLTVLTLPGSIGQRFGHWYFWDGWDYGILARFGYAPWYHSLAAYSPLYPGLAHLLILANIPWQAALLLVANLAGLAALLLVGLLVYHETSNEAAAIFSVLLLAVSPLGVFLSGMYSDSLFLALVAAAWLAARSGHWKIAGIASGLAVITRPFGLLLVAALLVELFVQGQKSWHQYAALLIPPTISLGVFLLVLWQSYGSPFSVFSAERIYFGRALAWPWQTFTLTVQQFANTPAIRIHILWDGLPLLLGILVVFLMRRRWPLSFSVYVAAVVLLCLVSPTLYATGQYALISDGRYMYAAAPLLVVPIACWLTRWPHWQSVSLLAASLMVQSVLVVFVLHGGWLV